MKKIFLACVLALTMMGCGSSKDDSIIVYTNSGSNGRDVFLKELAKENGFDINVVSGGGTDIANRLIAEKNNPIADVIFGLNNIEYEKLKKENILKNLIRVGQEKFQKDYQIRGILQCYNSNSFTSNI